MSNPYLNDRDSIAACRVIENHYYRESMQANRDALEVLRRELEVDRPDIAERLGRIVRGLEDGLAYHMKPCPECGGPAAFVGESIKTKPGDQTVVFWQCMGCKKSTETRW